MRLIPHPVAEMKVHKTQILGHVVGLDHETQLELTRRAIKQEVISEDSTQHPTPVLPTHLQAMHPNCLEWSVR